MDLGVGAGEGGDLRSDAAADGDPEAAERRGQVEGEGV